MNSFDCTEYKHSGHTIRVSWFFDNDMGPPWKEHAGHGSVRTVSSRDEKRPGEIILSGGRRDYWLYDLEGATRTGKRDGLGLAPDALAALEARTGRKPTRKMIVAEAVRRDADFLSRWLNNDWYWVGYTVEVFAHDDNGDADESQPLDLGGHEDSLWGIESDAMPEFEREIVERFCTLIDAEIAEMDDAACRDIATI